MAVAADALISKVVEILVSTIQQEYQLVAGVTEEVQKLTHRFQSIQDVLNDAERRQWKEETTVQLWLGRLKHTAYDIDDVVDEWSYQILRAKTEKDGSVGKPTGKVWSFNLLSACSCFPRVVSRHHMAVKISDLNEKLNDILIEKDGFNFQSLRSNGQQVERDMTTSDIDISKVKGREADNDILVNMLLAETSSQMSKLHLIPIVGMGGIGKTTLARLVYNDERVISRFDEQIWVCVSEPFDEIRIAKEILESLHGHASDLISLSNIMKKIKELVKGKKVLLVLDDVWTEDSKKWKQLEDCLKGGSLEITVLVTTRNENVGRVMGCSRSDIFVIESLSEEESWELFCMIAFSWKSREDMASLEKMGREIVGKCKGLPLAIKAIAGLLQSKESRMEWQNVLDSPFWGFEKVHKEIVGPIWLSFYDLPSPLKQCFLYYAVYPKDYEMKKGELIRRWMAQGYIKETQSKDLEMIGNDFFQNLIMRSLLLDANGFRTMCKMHDIVHDFAQLLVKHECLSIEGSNYSGRVSLDELLGDLLRHIHISYNESDEFSLDDSFYKLKKLRSLIVSAPVTRIAKPIGLDLERIFSKFTSLRSLVLSKCGIVEVPTSINRLIHLRELDLSFNYDLEELPDETWELYNLQILDVKENFKMQSVKGLGRLTNLRHLGNSNASSLLLPKEMERLSDLRSLDCLLIDVGNAESFSLKHLKNLNHLAGRLWICWLKRGDGDVEDAKQGRLQDKKLITQLDLFFGKEETDEKLAEALDVPPNLEILSIYNYHGLQTPKWFGSLTSVTEVKLRDCGCEHLPDNLGMLPFLKDLELELFSKVRKVGAEFLGIDRMMFPSSSSSTNVPLFPKLKCLRFFNFDSWEEWNGEDEEMMIMPSLTTLALYACPKLKALPAFINQKTSLKLRIVDCSALEQSAESTVSEEVLQWFFDGNVSEASDQFENANESD